MPINLNNTTPIDQNDLKFDDLLSNLQGNILKGHGRDHTANIFVEFDGSKLPKVRAWIHDFAAERVTSAKKQLKENERFKRHGIPGGMFAGIYVTAKGYDYFQVPAAKRPADPSFRNGMENAALADPPPAEWEPAFRELNIHIMVILGDDQKDVLSVAAAAIIKELRPLTTNDPFVSNAIRTEYGNAIKNANGDGLEHFGYVDGISQPLFFKDENEQFKTTATPSTGATLAWNPFAPLKLVLVKDPSVATPDSFGSYFVFRKLEQNVRAFKVAEQAIATALGLVEEEDREFAGALVVGRFEDGTPVTLLPKDGLIGSGAANNFNYSKDLAGLRCPFQAHIRKSNPRGTGGAEPLAGEKAHIMARRGIPFGLREVTPAIDSQPEQFPSGGVGLLFMSFQANLATQFEFIQKAWVNNADFPFLNPPKHTGLDPIIGQTQPPVVPPATDPHRDYQWPAKYGQVNPPVTATFAQFVNMKGGQYFFAPSIDGLKAL